MASPAFANAADVGHDHSQPSSPATQHQSLHQHQHQQHQHASHQQTPNTQQSGEIQPHHQMHHHHQHPDEHHHSQQQHPTPADMLAASAQMPPPFHPAAFPPGSVPVAYFASPHGGIIAIPQIKTKRRQVKNACTNCQKACKKCDEARPCSRCTKYGIAKDCIDSQRKERKKGIKRGPYKKRDQKSQQEDAEGSMAASMAEASYQSMQIPTGMAFYGYGPNGTPIFAQLPAKGPDGNYSYPQYYMPPPVEADPNAAGTPGLAYPPYYAHMVPPYGQQYPQHYMVPPSSAASGSGQPSQEMTAPSGGVPGDESPVFGLSPAMPSASHHDNDDSPIERPSAPLQYPPLDVGASSPAQDGSTSSPHAVVSGKTGKTHKMKKKSDGKGVVGMDPTTATVVSGTSIPHGPE